MTPSFPQDPVLYWVHSRHFVSTSWWSHTRLCNQFGCQDWETTWFNEQRTSSCAWVKLSSLTQCQWAFMMSSHHDSSTSSNNTYCLQSVPGSHPTKTGVIFISVQNTNLSVCQFLEDKEQGGLFWSEGEGELPKNAIYKHSIPMAGNKNRKHLLLT
jgi:hypothetical protein